MGWDRGKGRVLGGKKTRSVCKTHLRAKKSKKRCGLRQHFSTVSSFHREWMERREWSGGTGCECPERGIPQNGDLASPDRSYRVCIHVTSFGVGTVVGKTGKGLVTRGALHAVCSRDDQIGLQ